MSSQPPPPGPGQPDDDDPFRKQPPPGDPPPGSGSPYGSPPPAGEGPFGPPPPDDPYGGGPYGGGPSDPLAGMPPLATGGKRVVARIIDMVLVGVVVGLLSLAFGLNEFRVDTDEMQYGRSFGQSAVAAVLYIAYDTFFIARSGQTLGKRLMGMRVANLGDGATPSPGTSLLRAAVLWLPFAFCCACVWTIIAGGWSFFDKPFRQGLHDKAAKTVEVMVPATNGR